MRNMYFKIQKDSTHEEPLIHISIWIRKYEVANEEDDEVEDFNYSCKDIRIKNESTHQKKNISVQLAFSDIVWMCTCLYSVDVLCMFECLHLYY